MFTEIEIQTDVDFDDAVMRSLNVLCSDSMFILQNNSKVLKFLTDKTLSKELDILVQSVSMAIRKNRFELLQNIIFGLKEQPHKLAALEIKYFDETEKLLRSDIYKTFMPQNFKKHAFVTPALKEIFEIFNLTVKLSPTNAAFALKTSFEVGEQCFVEDILLKAELTGEFIRQIQKRYHANFGMTIEDEFENKKNISGRNNVIRNFLAKAV